MSDYTLEDLVQEREWRKIAPDWDDSPTDELLEAFLYFCSKYWWIRHPERGRIKFELFDAQIDCVRMWLDRALLRRPQGPPDRVLNPDLHVLLLVDLLLPRPGHRHALQDGARCGQAPREGEVRQPLPPRLDEVPRTSDADQPDPHGLLERELPREPAHRPVTQLAVSRCTPSSSTSSVSCQTARRRGRRSSRSPTSAAGSSCSAPLTVKATCSTNCGSASQNGTNRFKGLFFPWWSGDRDQDWYEAKVRDLPDWQLAQEYPSDPDEAFLRSGHPVFNVDAIKAMDAVDPDRGHLAVTVERAQSSRPADNGPLRVWEQPEPGRCVTSSEPTSPKDSNTATSPSPTSSKPRPVASSPATTPASTPTCSAPTSCSTSGAGTTRRSIGVESNNHGLTTNKALHRVGYNPLYQQRASQPDRPTRKPTEVLGWRTTVDHQAAGHRRARTRRSATASCTCFDAETHAELRTFVREGDGKMHGSPYDDRVMALAIATQMLKYVWLREYQPITEPPPGTFGYFEKMMFGKLEQNSNAERRTPTDRNQLRQEQLMMPMPSPRFHKQRHVTRGARGRRASPSSESTPAARHRHRLDRHRHWPRSRPTTDHRRSAAIAPSPAPAPTSSPGSPRSTVDLVDMTTTFVSATSVTFTCPSASVAGTLQRQRAQRHQVLDDTAHPDGHMKCKTCNKRLPEEGSTECFNCRVASVGFTFVGGGYTRDRFHNATIAEKRADVLGDSVLGVDVEPASNYGW